jgi:hypothetical protein
MVRHEDSEELTFAIIDVDDNDPFSLVTVSYVEHAGMDDGE